MFHRNFTYVFEVYGFIELFDYDLCSFTHDLGLFSTISKFEIYIIIFIAKTFITIVNRKSIHQKIDPIYETTELFFTQQQFTQ